MKTPGTVAGADNADAVREGRMLADSVYERVRERERAEPELVRNVMLALADPDAIVDTGASEIHLATVLVDQREREQLRTFLSGALTTSQVQEAITSLTDRRSVDARRRRGKLLGLRVGRETYHPDWQFAGGQTRRGLPELLDAIRAAVGDDPLAADALMRHPREELDGASLAELYAQDRLDEVVAHLATRAHGFAP